MIHPAKFPMKVVNITQVPNGGYSHAGRLAVDNAGKDAGIDDVFAPFDCRIVWMDKRPGKTDVVIQSIVPVYCADGITRNDLCVFFAHDNDVRNLKVGKILKQGEVFYQEGTAGRATGNHIHFNVGQGPYTGGYPLIQNSQGNWEIKNELDPTKIFFVTDENIVKNTKGMKWEKLEEKKSTEPVPTQLDEGDYVKIVGLKYATGQTVPPSVRSRVLRIQTIDTNGRAKLQPINSWVFLKDLKRVE